MPREIYPSSYECDCGHVSHFSESTVREMKQKSESKPVLLGEGAEEHLVLFKKGEMADIICPNAVGGDVKD